MFSEANIHLKWKTIHYKRGFSKKTANKNINVTLRDSLRIPQVITNRQNPFQSDLFWGSCHTRIKFITLIVQLQISTRCAPIKNILQPIVDAKRHFRALVPEEIGNLSRSIPRGSTLDGKN